MGKPPLKLPQPTTFSQTTMQTLISLYFVNQLQIYKKLWQKYNFFQGR